MSKTVPLLTKEIDNLKKINNSWERTDSLRKVQLKIYNDIIKDRDNSIDKLNRSIKVKNNIITYGAAGSCIVILLCLLLK